MCGIGGFLPARPEPERTLVRLLDTLAPRGPDDHGWLRYVPGGAQPEVGRDPPQGPVEGLILVHRRLSILDLGPAGHQPMVGADGRHALVYNGEVYNHEALRQELETKGHTFRSRTDSEVVLAALIEWGPAAVARFEGMFALAFLDTGTMRLILARDAFGIKPLFYTQNDDGFAFASDLRSLFTIPWVPREAHLGHVTRFLTGHLGAVPAGETLFRDVQRVPPGHVLTLDLPDGSAVLTPYVDLWPGRPLKVAYDEAVGEVRRRFIENVSAHLMADVPVGAALSGGIDSSAIVCVMRRLLGDDAPLHTFSYVPADPALSEETHMDRVAAHVGAIVHKVSPDPAEVASDHEALIRAHGEPVGSPSVYAQYRVFRLAREQGVPVVLDGQGADELLAGYRQYGAARLASLLMRGNLVGAWRLAAALKARDGTPKMRLIKGSLGQMVPRPVHRILKRLRITRREDLSWLRTAWLASQGVHLEGTTGRPSRHALRHRLHETLVQSSLPDLLRYDDRNSMAHSIESRVPFLTVGFAHYLLSLPEEYLLGPDGTTKRVFRDAMRGIVPDEVLDRTDKIGFVTTEADWLLANGSWVERILQVGETRGLPVFAGPGLWELWRRLRTGEREAARPLWRVLSVIQWADVMNVHFPGTAVPAVVPDPQPADVGAGIVAALAADPPPMPAEDEDAGPRP